MLRLGCLLVVVVLIAIPVIAAKVLHLPLWGTMLIIVAEAALLLIGGPKLAGWAVKRFMLNLFMTKSRALRDAGVHVHRVEPAPRPATATEATSEIVDASEGESKGDEEGSEDDAENDDSESSLADHRFVLVEFTVTPKPGSSKMSHWEPGEIMLVPFNAKVDPDHDTDDKQSANAHTINTVDDAGNENNDFDKVVGPARLRAIFAIPPTLSGRVKFRYYFEQFGDFLLP